MTDTTQQLAVYADVASGTGHTVVIARAGSGKTTTIERSLAHLPKGLKTIYVAFSKPVADSAKQRLRNLPVEVATCHSFGLTAIRETMGAINVDLNRGFNLASAITSNRSRKYALARAAGLAKGMLASHPDAIGELVDEYGVDFDGDQQTFAQDVARLLDLCERADDNAVDYDDMVWWPSEGIVSVPQYDRVFVDEVQDLNPAQLNLVLGACKPEGRILAVGDDRQSIMGFRGADRHAVPNVIARLKAKTLPLSTTFRCAKAIVAEAQKIVQDIQALENAAEGAVRSVSSSFMFQSVEYGDFILSRTNAPLIRLALKLIADGCRTQILGREIGTGLVNFVYKLKANSIYELRAKAQAHLIKETTRLMAKDPPRESAAQLVKDKVDCILAIADQSRSLEELVGKLKKLFEQLNPATCVTLATAHKAKGLERDRVWLLRDTFSRRPAKGEVSIEEKNIEYVAITRAKNELYYVRGD